MNLGYIHQRYGEPWYFERAAGFISACKEMGVQARLVSMRDGDGSFAFKLDGVAGNFSAEQEARVAEWGIPFVSLHPWGDRTVNQVLTDHDALGRMVLSYAESRGRTALGIFRSLADVDRHQKPLRECAIREAEKRGVQVFEPPTEGTRVSRAGWSIGRQVEDLADWLSDLPAGTMIFALDDDHAMRVLMAAELSKLAVPQRISVLGLGNDAVYCRAAMPAISSLAIAHAEKGREAAKLLMRNICGEVSEPQQILVAPRGIVERGSTGYALPEDPAVERVLNLLFDWEEDLPELPAIAKRAGLSLRTMQRRVKAATGKTPATLLQEARMDKVLKLLRETHLPLAEVADLSAYPLASQLSRDVKAATGMTARQYRQHWGSVY